MKIEKLCLVLAFLVAMASMVVLLNRAMTIEDNFYDERGYSHQQETAENQE